MPAPASPDPPTMTSSLYPLTVRVSLGTEFRMSGELPGVGSTLAQSGKQFVVVSCEELADHVYAVPVVEKGTLGASAGPPRGG